MFSANSTRQRPRTSSSSSASSPTSTSSPSSPRTRSTAFSNFTPAAAVHLVHQNRRYSTRYPLTISLGPANTGIRHPSGSIHSSSAVDLSLHQQQQQQRSPTTDRAFKPYALQPPARKPRKLTLQQIPMTSLYTFSSTCSLPSTATGPVKEGTLAPTTPTRTSSRGRTATTATGAITEIYAAVIPPFLGMPSPPTDEEDMEFGERIGYAVSDYSSPISASTEKTATTYFGEEEDPVTTRIRSIEATRSRNAPLHRLRRVRAKIAPLDLTPLQSPQNRYQHQQQIHRPAETGPGNLPTPPSSNPSPISATEGQNTSEVLSPWTHLFAAMTPMQIPVDEYYSDETSETASFGGREMGVPRPDSPALSWSGSGGFSVDDNMNEEEEDDEDVGDVIELIPELNDNEEEEEEEEVEGEDTLVAEEEESVTIEFAQNILLATQPSDTEDMRPDSFSADDDNISLFTASEFLSPRSVFSTDLATFFTPAEELPTLPLPTTQEETEPTPAPAVSDEIAQAQTISAPVPPTAVTDSAPNPPTPTTPTTAVVPPSPTHTLRSSRGRRPVTPLSGTPKLTVIPPTPLTRTNTNPLDSSVRPSTAPGPSSSASTASGPIRPGLTTRLSSKKLHPNWTPKYPYSRPRALSLSTSASASGQGTSSSSHYFFPDSTLQQISSSFPFSLGVLPDPAGVEYDDYAGDTGNCYSPLAPVAPRRKRGREGKKWRVEFIGLGGVVERFVGGNGRLRKRARKGGCEGMVGGGSEVRVF